MKLAISGKGGTGKTTVSALLPRFTPMPAGRVGGGRRPFALPGPVHWGFRVNCAPQLRPISEMDA